MDNPIVAAQRRIYTTGDRVIVGLDSGGKDVHATVVKRRENEGGKKLFHTKSAGRGEVKIITLDERWILGRRPARDLARVRRDWEKYHSKGPLNEAEQSPNGLNDRS